MLDGPTKVTLGLFIEAASLEVAYTVEVRQEHDGLRKEAGTSHRAHVIQQRQQRQRRIVAAMPDVAQVIGQLLGRTHENDQSVARVPNPIIAKCVQQGFCLARQQRSATQIEQHQSLCNRVDLLF